MERYTDPLDRASDLEQTERQRILDTRKRAKEAEEAARQTRDDSGRVICEDCLAVIPPERLLILPHAVNCVDCQDVFEKQERLYQ